MTRPLLLLDIDGVLNPFAACPTGYAEYFLFPDDEPVRLARMHSAWLHELSEPFEIVWASGWGDQANQLLGPILNLPDYGSVPFPPVPFEPEEKLPAIQSFVQDRAVAWVDDVLLPRAWAWSTERRDPTLLIAVDPAVGLEREHVDRLLRWARELAVSR